MSHYRGFSRGFWGGRWYEPLICEYDDLGRVLSIGDRYPSEGGAEHSEVTIDPRTFIQSPPNGHSHCFQFAIVGLTEVIDHGGDDFWAWRASMYQIALSISPEELGSIARALYTLMKVNGYRSVTEFHYLHHDPDGAHYEPQTRLADLLIESALEVGINIVLVPVYYKNGGFDVPATDEQRRFIFRDVQEYFGLIERLDQRWGAHPYVKIGKGVHSLRAASREDIITICASLEPDRPFHIHISEQTREVEMCQDAWGQRPVQWLLDHVEVTENYHLVHATHLDEDEIKGIARSGASVTLCPTTEGNLGDGVFPLAQFLKAQGSFWIGSDSHVTVSPLEELRTLDYSQRFMHRRRGVVNASRPGHRGDLLWTEALNVDEYGDGRAPFLSGLLLKTHNVITSAKRRVYLMSALVYGGGPDVIDAVMINGVESSREIDREIAHDFARVVSRLG